MTLQELYELGVEMGMKADPRGLSSVKRLLEKRKKSFADLPEKKKIFFDKESFTNPYSDSRILFGDPKLLVKKVMVGIDADGAEILIADRLNQKSEGIDLVISHHPSGHALASLDEVMDVQVDMFAQAGVPVNVAHSLFDQRKSAVKRKIGPINHSQAVDAARLLNIPLLALHTIWDNVGNHFMSEFIGKKKFDTVGEILDAINEIPEFTEAVKGKAGPSIVSGSEKSRAGKIVVSFTGGTNPSKELYVEMAKAGIGTIIEMHVPEDAVLELRKLHINVIDCGHMAADSIGANLYLDQLEKRGVEVIPCSGLIRVKRIK
ncbi:MAG: NGG1p interacting factor NIF3 [Candidatus Levybacteria bacterium RIFCSPHIGHO2_12_FULL_38_12]|nr:MAG: NGG1p interacting factor NIF3 [Candidatus Levybacteria bacterium RIFCSPHIGHO2_01_FULL_38_12]OGH21571.1 MAG: NGG1p interacting factor NIF3 [Candidatus Levybacteria bacterium RIFCSPHIGHO2_02_FULL_37_18]OGH23092.1 MAG: NGG1p interacting factor NIF3 [Candidatus Levybacteria bacterium RIFCSPHIGHO2_12_FULL_38_12]OGH34736.1 MAG: NGG1p interacting factor NIF3 [Candidatus Levybacteria bacterium RIFCSPLOWO2_01_FULL_37_20]OGH43583.1 MAG: NGG1p interacting factor NIF3 [Candidatus Levybacteria bacte